jgi:hypothetical protein
MIGWCVVVGLALLAFYVHILNEQVLRGERHREEMRQSPVISSPGSNAGSLARTARNDRVLRMPTRNANTAANGSAQDGAANP